MGDAAKRLSVIGSLRLRRLAATGLFLAAALVPPMAQARVPQRLIQDPVWAREPDNEQFLSFYPPVARAQNRGGWAVVSCRALANGGLTGCKVAIEAPADLGFGAAARRMASQTFSLKPSTRGGQSVEGGYVHLPIVFQPVAGGTVPPQTFAAGQPAMLVKPLSGGQSAPDAFPCPAPGAPNALCKVHAISWTTRPDADVAAPILRAAGQTRGVSTLDCAVGDEGGLTDCEAGGDLTPSGKTAILKLAQAFKAPPRALDGTATRGERIASVFDWATLLKAYEVLAPAEP